MNSYRPLTTEDLTQIVDRPGTSEKYMQVYNGSNTKSEKYVYTGSELLRMDFKQEWLIEGLLPHANVAGLVGIPDSGKSQFARMLALSVVGGLQSFLGMQLSPKYRSVIFVSTEDGKEQTAFLMRTQATALGIQFDDVDRIRFVFPDGLTTEEVLGIVEAEMEREPADLVVIDSFGDIHVGDQSSNSDIRRILKPITSLSNIHGTAVLILHHLNKAGYSQTPGQQHIAGGAAIAQKLRLVLELRSSHDGQKYLICLKGNYVSRLHKNNARILEFDEASLIFTDTERTISLDEIVPSMISKRNGVSPEWDNLFSQVDLECTSEEVLTWFKTRYGLAKTQAHKYIRDAVQRNEVCMRKDGSKSLYRRNKAFGMDQL